MRYVGSKSYASASKILHPKILVTGTRSIASTCIVLFSQSLRTASSIRWWKWGKSIHNKDLYPDMVAPVLHISGPPKSGKTGLVERLAANLNSHPPHLVRFHLKKVGRSPTLRPAQPLAALASSKRRDLVDPKRVFEAITEAVQEIMQLNDAAPIIIETDAEPCFRHAYPYDVKVFIMRPPRNLSDVFRSARDAATAMQRALEDTAEFAAEMFGLHPEPLDAGLLPDADPPKRMARDSLGCTHNEFLNSDIGMEVSARMMLHPAYHAVVESDVILLNEGLPSDCQAIAELSKQLDTLLEGVRRQLKRQAWFASCNPLDENDRVASMGVERILALLTATRKSVS